MSNIATLPGVNLGFTPEPSTVQACRDLLARAEAGTLRTIAACGINDDGTTMTSIPGTRHDAVLLQGAMSVAAHLHRSRFIEE